ncbi:DUF4367 domain-containing protein [Proteiniborus sp. MB09-C3]|uniref:DUF4367 domain-containing protein n=1 Tax=Proteiniborus sp. MB09-C3 TaxID=3050072 RepID=UPI002554EA9B|nr:DUF4367 domain-containing protein [Proteiniborus sp. MB09-C3]WIV13506.1 DUF4367 domain-containing protein [Proteiniborus sp. MB09-C3]
MSSENALDNILTMIFKEAELIVLDNISEKESKEKHAFSEKFNDKMAKLIAYEKRRSRIKNTLYYFKKAVSIFLIVLTVVFASTMSVKAWRVKLFNTIINIFEKFSEIRYENVDKGVDRIEDNTFYAPEYVPDGFNIEKEDINFFGQLIIYKNKNGEEIVFEQYKLEHRNMIIDTEGTELEPISIKKFEGYFYSNKGTNNIFWDDGYCGFIISSSINKQEIIKIAKSIKTKK